jgi:O-antigen/teichoic acid export membrane protein
MRVSTIISIGLLILALVFAVLGFLNAPNSEISPAAIATFMFTSAALFGILAVRGLRRQETWQRFLGVAAATAALYMVAMAILFFQVLNSVVMPSF